MEAFELQNILLIFTNFYKSNRKHQLAIKYDFFSKFPSAYHLPVSSSDAGPGQPR
jgi:hypothetical protein